ncbi:MAG TPA: hypothetical protein VFI34_05335, partial [Candidatus Limnocylindrales bacterium]|nr:hypothetical protein [Candidatus Limnocylindrales bacterium]
VVAQTAQPTTARIAGRPIGDAHDVDLLGRRLGDLPVDPDGALSIPLRPWEIRTIRFADG